MTAEQSFKEQRFRRLESLAIQIQHNANTLTVGVRKLFELTSGLKEGGSGDGSSTSAADQAAKSQLDRAIDDLQDIIDNQQKYNNNATEDGNGTPSSTGNEPATPISVCSQDLRDYQRALARKDLMAANNAWEIYQNCLRANANKPHSMH